MSDNTYLDDMGDSYSAAQATAHGWSAAPNSILNTGRVSGNCMRLNNATRTRPISPNAEQVFGIAFRFASAAGTITIRLIEGGAATEHMRLNINTVSGAIEISRATAIAVSVIRSLATNTWHYIEAYYKCHDTTGAWEVRLNGTDVLIGPTSSLDTRNGGTAGVLDTLSIQAPGQDVDLDDLYIRPGSTFMGDVRVIAQAPNGNGNHSQWTGSDGNSTDNYLLVDDGASHDTDTTYVASSTTANKDTYGFPALGVTGSVRSVCVVAVVRKDDAAARQFSTMVRAGGTDYAGSRVTALGTTYAAAWDAWDTNPDTGSAWSVSGVNGAEYGIKDVT